MGKLSGHIQMAFLTAQLSEPRS
uniref:Uncharacterized protein n=1 Tax=Anguilla anguilla TaxID=7936 RepID=A0A0E9S0Y4_ANGAN